MQPEPSSHSPVDEIAKEEGKRYGTAIVLAVFTCTGYLGILGMLFSVVPVFQKMFESFGGKLPWATRVVVGLSNFCLTYWWFTLPVLVGPFALAMYALFKEEIDMQTRVHVLILFFVGVCVIDGMLLVSMYLPIFRLVTIIGN